ncbi:Uncharacterised protein [Bifidobacterium catenulatum]|uniref:hypothetical protein n=1 Tax=Bifidobacterium catenulatum TaxID=1686 RepID=UPI00116A64D0|nr:hypothetical protein [Bifidobacterium catenulatum]VUX36118.1 Uncharacterised protein [Bifidobacterium catenulatum]
MNGKREKTNAHGAGRILSYEPLKVHCDGSIKCGCLLEFDGITAWRAHLATAILKALSRISS